MWLLKDWKFSKKICQIKNGVCEESAPNRPNSTRDILAWKLDKPFSDPTMVFFTDRVAIAMLDYDDPVFETSRAPFY